jgi:flagellar protein FliO/FliZ
MLLVKSRELKSSGNKFHKSARKTKSCAYSLFSLTALLSPFAHAQSDNAITNPTSVASIFLSLLLVIAIIFALAYVMRRFNVTQAGNGQMKVVASMVAGTKERLMVVEVGEEQYLLGVTSHSINHLATLPSHIESAGSAGGEIFKDKLVQAMAGKLSGSKSGAKS